MELKGNVAGGGGGAVFWSHSDRGGERVQCCGACTMAGRGLHSSTSQLNLSRFETETHPAHPSILPSTP